MSETEVLTVENILNSSDALRELTNKDVDINIGVSLAKTLTEFECVLNVFNKNRNAILDKYSHEVDGQTKIKEEFIDTYNTEYTKLLNTEVDVVFNKIDVNLLKDIRVKTSTLLILNWLIEL